MGSGSITELITVSLRPDVAPASDGLGPALGAAAAGAPCALACRPDAAAVTTPPAAVLVFMTRAPSHHSPRGRHVNPCADVTLPPSFLSARVSE